jgi:membrane protease YdiL (CAAX protease family)
MGHRGGFMRRIKLAVIFILFSFSALAFCQEGRTNVRESDVVAALSISAALNLGSVAECFFAEEDFFPALFFGTVTAQNIPAIMYGSKDALLGMGIQLGLEGLYFGNKLAFGSNALSPVLFNFAHKYSMFSTYSTYADLRSRTENPRYAAFGRYSFLELASAPFDPECYADWAVLGYVGSIALVTGIEMLKADKANAVWTRGTSYVGSSEYPIWAGAALMLLLQVPNFVMTGIGEESFYRGTLYEELSYRLGEWPARLIDSFYFTVSHYPQRWDQIIAEAPAEILLNLGLSMLQGMWFQFIYDRKGLRSAVATHAAVDIIGFFCDWLVQGGVPNGSGFSINERELSISMNFKL